MHLKLPSDLLKLANLLASNLSLEAARLLALDLFHGDKVSPERAAELCETPATAFMDFTTKHGVPRYVEL